MLLEEMSAFWTKVGELFEQTCKSTEPVWQKRRRVIDTRLLVVFILKLVFSRNRQGNGSSLGALCVNQRAIFASDQHESLPIVLMPS